jgi:hypothetical protein
MNDGVATQDEDPRQLAVGEALEELQGALTSLADDLATARNPRWDDPGDFEGSAREVLHLSTHLAQALVDWLEPMDLIYGDLDQVLRAIASRVPSLSEHAKHGTRVFEFLRLVSYAGSLPDPGGAPSIEDFNAKLEDLVNQLDEQRDEAP